MYKAVIFDLGQTVIPFDISRGYAALAPYCSLDRAEMRRRVSGAAIIRDFEVGRVTPQEFVEQFSSVLGLNLRYEQFCELWSSIFLPEPLVPEELLAGLRQRYRLLALSNTNSIHFEVVRQRYPILRHFDELVLSFEVGSMKPEPDIYRVAVERAGCHPNEILCIDDMPEYVEAGRRAGLDAVQFRGAEQVKQDLRERGIEWQ